MLKSGPFPPQSVAERALKISFTVLLAVLAASFPISLVAALTTGFEYGPAATQAAYPTLAMGLAPVLGAAVLGLILTAHSLRARIDGIERGLLRFLDRRGEWATRGWDEDLEETLRSRVDLGQFAGEEGEVQEALQARDRLLRMKAWTVRLFSLPVFGLSLIVGLSLWAVPASAAFLFQQVVLNTTLLFFTSYGAMVSIAALLTALFLVRQE